jgi:hypothetical protein
LGQTIYIFISTNASMHVHCLNQLLAALEVAAAGEARDWAVRFLEQLHTAEVPVGHNSKRSLAPLLL